MKSGKKRGAERVHAHLTHLGVCLHDQGHRKCWVGVWVGGRGVVTSCLLENSMMPGVLDGREQKGRLTSQLEEEEEREARRMRSLQCPWLFRGLYKMVLWS